jgi:ATP-dependent helicase HrpA
VLDSPEEARAVHRAGVRRLLAIAFRERVRDLQRSIERDPALGPLKDDLVAAALDRAFLAESVPTLAADFARRIEEGRSRFGLIAQEMQRAARTILDDHHRLEKRILEIENAFPGTAKDMQAQFARLLAPGWLARMPWERIRHFPRYLKAAVLRLDKLRAEPARDARLMTEMAPLLAAWQRETAQRARSGAVPPALEQFGWLLEELRVSLFAQQLKTPVPVSVKRLSKVWQSMKR